MGGFSFLWINIVFSLLVGVFLYIRQYDISEASFSPLNNVMLGIAGLSTFSLFWSPCNTWGTLVRRLALILLVLMHLKTQLDSTSRFAQIKPRKGGSVALITGGNGSLGRNIAASLVELDINVVLACRDLNKCQQTVNMLKSKIPLKSSRISSAAYALDLSSLAGVRTFAEKFQEEHGRLDFLVHAAGSVHASGVKSRDGLEESFASLYLAPFALSHWLMPLLMKPVDHNPFGANAARIISVVSHAAFTGRFNASMLNLETKGDFENEYTDNCGKEGSLDAFSSFWCIMGKPPLGNVKQNGYSRAMLSVILGTQELQRRIDHFHSIPPHNATYRRVVTATVNPGMVSSTISPVHTIFGPVLRPGTVAATVVSYALLSDAYLPSSYIDSSFNAQDLAGYRDEGLATHLTAFPQLIDAGLDFLTTPPSAGVYSSSMVKFKGLQLIDGDMSAHHRTVSARLYDVSLQFIADERDGHPTYTTKVGSSATTFKFLRRSARN